MPKDYLSSYSATAGSNTDIGGVNIDEGCAPSTINDAIREQMSHLAGFKAETETGAAVASATALPVNIAGVSHSVTGTTTVETLASPTNDTSHIKYLQTNDIVQFTHSANLIMPGGVDYTSAAGDVIGFIYDGSSVWRCIGFNTLGGSGGVGGGTKIVGFENDNATDGSGAGSYTISTNKNMVSAGTLTITAGDTITVPTGSTWTIV